MTSNSIDRFGSAPGEGVKSPVRVVATSNITLSGLQDVDTVSLAPNDRVLAAGQDNPAERGIYVVQPTAWTRATDFNDNNDFVSGVIVIVDQGTANNIGLWQVSFTGQLSIGTTPLAFNKATSGGGGAGTNLSYTASSTNGTVASSTGSNAILPAATGANAGLFLPTEKTKLAGVETGATADQTGGEIVTSINTELGGTGWQSGGSGNTDLAYTASATQGIVTSSSGNDATLPAATSTNAGLMLPGEKDMVIDVGRRGAAFFDDYKTASNTNNQAFTAAVAALPANGGDIFFGSAIYTFTAGLTITTGNAIDETPRVGLRGAGPGSTALQFSHNGNGITLTGGTGGTAGAHSYQTIQDLRILKQGGANSRTGGGLTGDNLAYLRVKNCYITNWNTAISLSDVLSSSFKVCNIRNNDRGVRMERVDFSEPNAVTFYSCVIGTNDEYGITCVGGATLNIYGGSIENNGIDTSVAATGRYGVLMSNSGLEGKVGLNMSGVYLEGNGGTADVWITNTTHDMAHALNGCSFNRISSTTFTTYNVRVEASAGVQARVGLTGCGFGNDGTYVPDAARPTISVIGNEAAVEDGGGNMFENTVDAFTFAGGGGGATNLGYATAATTGTVTSSTGSDATIPAATASTAGLMTNADKTKLDEVDSNLIVKAFAVVSSAGAIQRSSSVNVGAIRNGAGDYTVSYPASASLANAIDILTCAGNGLIINVFNVANSSVRVQIRDTSGTLTDSGFNVIRI